MESYIADIALFLMETLGPKRAEIFKRTHLGIKPEKPLMAAQTIYTTPGKKQADPDNDLLNDSRNPQRYSTLYGSGHMNRRGP